MKTKKKVPVKTAVPSNGCTYEPQHDFFQVGEPSSYGLTGSSLGQMGQLPSQRQPRFVCRKCGKVIQL